MDVTPRHQVEDAGHIANVRDESMEESPTAVVQHGCIDAMTQQAHTEAQVLLHTAQE